MNKGHERSINAKKNILYSFLIKGVNIGVSFLMVPLTINYVDKFQYGIWLTLSSIIAWFGFFDIGFGNGLRNKLAEAIAQKKYKLARVYISTTYVILSVLILIMLVIFLFINPFLNWASILNTPQEMADELNIIAMVVFMFFCLQFILQLITIILIADQQTARASIFNFFGNVIALIVVYILTKTTHGSLIYLSFALGASPVIVLIISSMWFFKREYKKYAPSLKYVRFRFGRKILNIGLKFFVIQIAVIILYQTSNIIISQMYSPNEVTPYNITFKYFSAIPMVFGVIIAPMWSAFTEAWVKKDLKWIESTMKRLKLLWVVLTVLAIIMVFASKVIYSIWVGEKINIEFSLTITMAIYVVINLWNGIYSQFLNGVGKIKLQLIIAVIGSIINIPLSVFFCKEVGVYGVILSTIFISLPGLIIYPIQYKKIVLNKALGIWSK